MLFVHIVIAVLLLLIYFQLKNIWDGLVEIHKELVKTDTHLLKFNTDFLKGR